MNNKVLMFSYDNLCYGSTNYFTEKIAEQMRKCGLEVTLSILEKGNEDEVIAQYSGKTYAAVFDINTAISLKYKNINAPIWHYILDHPLYHQRVLGEHMDNMNVITIDEEHKKYIEKYYPWIKKVVCQPLAAQESEKFIPFKNRKIDLLFTGGYVDSEEVLSKVAAQNNEDLDKLFEKIVSELFADETKTMEEVVCKYMLDLKSKNVDEGMPKVMQLGYLADVYVRARVREELLGFILKNGIDITIYGFGWDKFMKKPYVLGNGYGKIDYRGSVKYNELPDIYMNSRVSLNVMPWFKNGVHDRVIMSMMNASLCVTDENLMTEKIFTDGYDICTYQLGDMQTAADVLKEIMNNPEEAERIAAHGFENALKNHTWKKVTQKIIENILH